MRNDDWTIVAAGVVILSDGNLWYCISVFEVGEATLPVAA